MVTLRQSTSWCHCFSGFAEIALRCCVGNIFVRVCTRRVFCAKIWQGCRQFRNGGHTGAWVHCSVEDYSKAKRPCHVRPTNGCSSSQVPVSDCAPSEANNKYPRESPDAIRDIADQRHRPDDNSASIPTGLPSNV